MSPNTFDKNNNNLGEIFIDFTDPSGKDTKEPPSEAYNILFI